LVSQSHVLAKESQVLESPRKPSLVKSFDRVKSLQKKLFDFVVISESILDIPKQIQYFGVLTIEKNKKIYQIPIEYIISVKCKRTQIEALTSSPFSTRNNAFFC